MYNTYKIPFVRSFFRCLLGGVAVCILLCATVLIQTKDAYAKVCFLPGGKCPGDAMMSSVTAVQGNQCLGYTLTQIKCKDQACEEGWNCESCTNAQGTYYKCTEKPTPPGFTKGVNECSTPCQAYEHSGFTGNQINGKCTQIPGYSTKKPAVCTTFQTPDYVYGIRVSGNNMEDLHSKDKESYKCYYNVQALTGGDFKREKPASCTTYDTKMDSYNEKCYANAKSIGEHFTTNKSEHFPNIFNIEEKAGTDGVMCYRVKREGSSHCNSVYGWSDESPNVSIFDVESKTLEGYTCYRAKGCNAGNNYSEQMPDAKYFESEKHEASQGASYSGKTCYRAKGCINGKGLDGVTHHSYSTQPDTRFFKSTDMTSNGKQCWIATGKSDYAYVSGDKKNKFFDYESGTADLTASNGTISSATYYVVKSGNGRNGCMQYAYEDEPDGKYFAKTSQAQYSNGSSTKKTCWNITGKGSYAYTEDQQVTTHFVYDAGKEGYLNGTSSKGKYYNMTGRNEKAYEAVTDTTHFAYDEGIEQYKNGVNSKLKIYVATGCSGKAYANNTTDTTHFAYDSGKQRYFNGAGSKKTCYNITGCGSNAYPSITDTTHFAYDSGKKAYFSGAGDQVTCYNVTGCGSNAYANNTTDTTHFAYDSGKQRHFNGAEALTYCYNITGCSSKAYDSKTDTTHFAYDGGKIAKINGKDDSKTCYVVSGCSANAVLTAGKDDHFAYDAGKQHFFNGAGNLTYCYLATGCNTTGGALATTGKDTTRFAYDSGATQNGHSCVKATGCAANVVLAADRNTNYFVYDAGATQTGFTCHKVSSCVSTAVEASGKKTAYLTYDEGATSGGKTCYKATGCNTAGGALAKANKKTDYFKYLCYQCCISCRQE